MYCRKQFISANSWGEYPQRQAQAYTWRNSYSGLFALIFRDSIAPYKRFAQRVTAAGDLFTPLPKTALSAHAMRVRRELIGTGSEEKLVEAFALVCAALFASLQLRAYPSQVMAARVMLDGRLAEMQTGEGKTVSIAIAAGIAALMGIPVHVITANDYLASRDAASMAPFFSTLGVTVGAVIQQLEQAQRKGAWSCSVTYCTAKELVFDYLRDGLTRNHGLSELEHRARRLTASSELAKPLLHGLCLAIVDEADTVLIDEASVPLVLSQQISSGHDSGFLLMVVEQAAALREHEHFHLFSGSDPEHRISLTEAGQESLSAWPQMLEATHNDLRHRETMVALALTALHKLKRDRHYMVDAGKVTIIDETTGRAARGRAWSRGLHQFVEIKEGCTLTQLNETVAQITYQRFFPRYLHLCGMSGTLNGSTYEMAAIYGLSVVVIPPRLPPRRRELPMVIFPASQSLWIAVAARALEIVRAGRPVLVGTASIAESEQLSAVLNASDVPHRVLNARQDQDEHTVIERAGALGCVTVATSMAGRGTDIVIRRDIAELGGLHVILCQHNCSTRIDRQFLGRTARQGQPGSSEVMLALDFPNLRGLGISKRLLGKCLRLPQPLLRLLVAYPQWIASHSSRKTRLALSRADADRERELPFNLEKIT